jgi:flagellar motor switch protein FliM
LNPSLVFPVIEILLGGSGKSGQLKMEREVTEIEQSVLDGLYRIILHDMQQAWGAVTSLDFEYSNIETEPQMLQILAPNEAVVAISMEIRVGESAGMMNIGIPSIIIKMLRQKFDQQWSMRKSESTEVEHERMFRLIQPSLLNIDCRLSGPTITVQDFLQLEEGHVLRLDYAVDRPVKLVLNGYEKFTGYVVDTGRKLAFQVHQPVVRESLRLELKAAS